MKNLFTGLIALAIFIIICYIRKSGDLPEDRSELTACIELSKPAECPVPSNKYLDIDTNLIYHLSTAREDDKKRAKAVVCRFFKHVTIKDSIYVTDLKSGREINISAGNFNFLRRNMQELNQAIIASRAKGEYIDPAAIGDQYLSSLSE
ncbi:MAG: hypothetical protein JWQ66_2369 [Mucilaginibacter sp.]|nr:hypothetical protein [Mucilaginibacter sp.]